ncbi:MAG: permease [Candidatus Omnitrophota bacterium]
MSFLSQFVTIYFAYLQELWLALFLGFFLSGLCYEFIPTKMVERYLGRKGLVPILSSSILGAVLPICCFGSLPVAVTLKRKGAKLGPVLAFLITTPATSVPALIISWKLLGPIFTVYIFCAVIVMGFVMGLVGNMLRFNASATELLQADPCCANDLKKEPLKTVKKKIRDALTYGFITLPQAIGLSLLLGIAVASLIAMIPQAQQLLHQYLTGIQGYCISLAAGFLTYACSTGSVPLADALLKSGVTPGSVMIYLIAGPITSYGMIFTVKKEFGLKVLSVYVLGILLLSLSAGMGYNFLVTGDLF